MAREKVVFQAESAETVTENIEEKISETARENSQTENGVYVKGMALPFGKTSRNGVQYEKESVKQNAEDLIGRPILFNHKQDYGTGHILNIEVTDDGMYYEGDINPNAEMPNGVSVAEAVERGDIRSPSIQAFIEQTGEEADEDAVVADMQTEKVKVADFIEISMVTVPGFPQASAMPEHLQNQGVKPITEAIGVEKEQYGDSDDEEEEEEQTGEDVKTESFEFDPVPDHVLYGDREDAMQRARNLGLDDIHEHEMSGQIYYMAGDTHEEWRKALDRENPTDRENHEEQEDGKRAEPFAGYDDFEDCVQQNQDKDDAEAYCAAIKRKTEQAGQLKELKEQVETTPTEEMAEIASTALQKIEDGGIDNDDCATRVGLERANQLENRESLSEDTINRMVSFFARHDGNQQVDDGVDNKWEDCGYVAWQLWGGDPGREWAERKQEQFEDEREEIMLGENQTMTEQEQEEDADKSEDGFKTEQLEQVDEDDFTGTVADMYEEVSAADAAALMEDFTFTGDPGPLVAQVADIADMTPGELMEILEEGMSNEEEKDGMDDDEDDDENEESGEEQGQEEVEEKDREELEEQFKQQSQKIEELEDRLETILDNDEGKSKQSGPSSEEDSVIERRPSFKGLTD